jgi:hypothetical protein
MRLTSKNATYKLINEILTALSSKLMVRGIFVILKKPDILLLELETYGITGKLCYSYLKGRYQGILTH